MQIQINTDSSVEGSKALVAELKEQVGKALDRFQDRITRVEVHLTDVNADKGGVDIRCVMEARVAGMDPMAVEEQAETIPGAVRGASSKLTRVLDSRFDRARGY